MRLPWPPSLPTCGAQGERRRSAGGAAKLTVAFQSFKLTWDPVAGPLRDEKFILCSGRRGRQIGKGKSGSWLWSLVLAGGTVRLTGQRLDFPPASITT